MHAVEKGLPSALRSGKRFAGDPSMNFLPSAKKEDMVASYVKNRKAAHTAGKDAQYWVRDASNRSVAFTANSVNTKRNGQLMRVRSRKNLEKIEGHNMSKSLDQDFSLSKVFVEGNVRKGTNVSEFQYLPENIREWTMPGPFIRRNPTSPVEMLSSGMMMAQAQAAGMGRNLTAKQKRALGRSVRDYGEGRMFIYSPLGRGSVMT